MANFWIILLLLTIFTGRKAVSRSPRSTINNFQRFMDQLCVPDTTTRGCNGDNILSSTTGVSTAAPVNVYNPGVSTATPVDIDIRVVPDGSSVPSLISCSLNEKRCPHPLNQCVPNHYNCTDIHKGLPCPIPQEDLLVTKTLLCGDGTRIGDVCGNADGTVPILTLLLVQCYAGSDVNLKPITSLNVVSGPDGKGGAGVYWCSPEGKWDPWKDSPSKHDLIESCRNDGCGRVPHPSDEMSVWRRWAWVRTIYKGNYTHSSPHCTATLVSPTAAVTAAHCLTESIGDDRPNKYFCKDYELELPGPTKTTIKVQLDNIYFHPKYSYNNGNPQHNLAVVFFPERKNTILPTVCITDRYHRRTRGTELVFNQMIEEQKKDQTQNWNATLATIDFSCTKTKTQFSVHCGETVNIQQSQFCASHKGIKLNGSSHGEPYLVDVGEGGKEEWVLMGIRSLISTIDPCPQENSIYEQVADNTNWIKKCVFEENCTYKD